MERKYYSKVPLKTLPCFPLPGSRHVWLLVSCSEIWMSKESRIDFDLDPQMEGEGEGSKRHPPDTRCR